MSGKCFHSLIEDDKCEVCGMDIYDCLDDLRNDAMLKDKFQAECDRLTCFVKNGAHRTVLMNERKRFDEAVDKLQARIRELEEFEKKMAKYCVKEIFGEE